MIYLNMDKIAKDNFIEVKVNDNQKSLFFIKNLDEIFSAYSPVANCMKWVCSVSEFRKKLPLFQSIIVRL